MPEMLTPTSAIMGAGLGKVCYPLITVTIGYVGSCIPCMMSAYTGDGTGSSAKCLFVVLKLLLKCFSGLAVSRPEMIVVATFYAKQNLWLNLNTAGCCTAD